MRKRAIEICELFPQIGRIRVEANQGGETWHSVFHDMPVKVVIHHEQVPKKVRASHLLNHYQRKARKSVAKGKSESVRGDPDGRGINTQKNTKIIPQRSVEVG